MVVYVCIRDMCCGGCNIHRKGMTMSEVLFDLFCIVAGLCGIILACERWL